MVFDAFKKWFGKSKIEETSNHKMEIINEELDQFEKEIQEYIHYSEERGPEEKKEVSQPDILAQGGGHTSSSLITPEEEKRISGEPQEAT